MNTSAENLEMMRNMASDGYESVHQLGDINLRTWKNISEKQSDISDIWLEAGTRQIELGTAAKDPKDFLRSQLALTQDMGVKMRASLHDAFSSGGEAQEYRTCFEKSVQAVAGNRSANDPAEYLISEYPSE